MFVILALGRQRMEDQKLKPTSVIGEQPILGFHCLPDGSSPYGEGLISYVLFSKKSLLLCVKLDLILKGMQYLHSRS